MKTVEREASRLKILRKIAKYLKDGGGWQHLRAPDYLERSPRVYQHDGCQCKICGAIIQKLVPHPRNPRRLVLTLLPSYREISIDFSDGSKHITPICLDCMSGKISIPVLREMYLADLLAFDKESEFGLSPWEILDREPIRWKPLK